MRIWPWYRFKELEAQNDQWMNRFIDLYKMQKWVLEYLDTVEPGRHVCIKDKMYIFKKDSTWVLAENQRTTENHECDLCGDFKFPLASRQENSNG